LRFRKDDDLSAGGQKGCKIVGRAGQAEAVEYLKWRLPCVRRDEECDDMKNFPTLGMVFLGFGLAMAGSAQTATQEMKQAGTETKEAAKSAGRSVKKGTKNAAHNTKRVAKKGVNKVASGTEKGAEKLKEKTTTP